MKPLSSRKILTEQRSEIAMRLDRSQSLRYICAVAAVVLASVIARVAQVPQISILILFGAVLVASLLGGLFPGLLASAMASWAGYSVLRISHPDLHILIVEFVLLACIGGRLRSARRKSRDQLAANLRLEQQILEIGDDERRRIGHDLHDGLGQHLTGISLLSETMAQQLTAGQNPHSNNVETITRLVSEAVGITRDLAKSLSPVTLERDGLIAAIEELADTSAAIFGIEVISEIDEQTAPHDFDHSRALHLYRIVQEAVNNSVRHGKSKHVRIELSSDEKELIVLVTDDGSGLSSKTLNNPGLGLRIMQYRARMLGATLAVERATSRGGTVVICKCPLIGVVGNLASGS